MLNKLKTLGPKKLALAAIALLLVGAGVVLMSKKGSKITPLDIIKEVNKPKTATYYIKKAFNEPVDSVTIKVYPLIETADLEGAKMILKFKKSDEDEASLFEATIQFGKRFKLSEEIELYNPTLKLVGTDTAVFFKLKADNLEQIVSPILSDMQGFMGQLPQGTMDVIRGDKWVYVDLEELQQTLEEQQNTEVPDISPKTVEKMYRFVFDAFVVKNEKQEGDVKIVEFVFSKESVDAAYKELIKDEKFLKGLAEIAGTDVDTARARLTEDKASFDRFYVENKEFLDSLYVYAAFDRNYALQWLRFELEIPEDKKQNLEEELESSGIPEALRSAIVQDAQDGKIRLAKVEVTDVNRTEFVLPNKVDAVPVEQFMGVVFMFMFGVKQNSGGVMPGVVPNMGGVGY